LVVSDFAAAKFASVSTRLMRMGFVPEDEARAIFSRFDAWRARAENVDGADIEAATATIRQLNLNIRAGRDQPTPRCVPRNLRPPHG
jgi:hypothetical protein